MRKVLSSRREPDLDYTPIILFVYKRQWHTQQTIEALQRNDLASDSDLIIYSDAPKNEEAAQGVREVREYIHSISGFRTITIIERNVNFGLAQSIITGVTEVVNRYGRIIVLEDDLMTSPYFLRYMNEALQLYQNEERVASIHGYIYPDTAKLPETFFLKGADCWGWATWKRGWDLFEVDGQKLVDELKEKKLTHEFDFDDSYEYTVMLEDQVNGKTDSWAIRWYASTFLKNTLTLYPGRSLVCNIGIDGSGTNCLVTNMFQTHLSDSPICLEKIPIKENSSCRKSVSHYFKPPNIGFFGRVCRKLSRIFHSTISNICPIK